MMSNTKKIKSKRKHRRLNIKALREREALQDIPQLAMHRRLIGVN